MSRISPTGVTTSAGLVSGIPIEDTVNQLIAVSSGPRNILAGRNQGVAAERAAVDQLASLTLGVQLSLSNLRQAGTFASRTASSSNSELASVSVNANATPPPGSFQFTPLRQASPNQFVSNRIDDVNDIAGALSFGFGGRVDDGLELAELSREFSSGSIRITDREGSSATIDLRGAQTVDDVLEAINAADEIDVTASTDGDRFVLIDNTGGAGTLRVREVGGGSTGESLGLVGTVSADTLTGEDVFGLATDTRLDDLNDGLGVRRGDGNLTISLADGSNATVDLSSAQTIGDVLEAINGAAGLGDNLTASLGADGNRLVLTDASTGDDPLVVSGTIAEDLGLEAAAEDGVSGTLDGGRLVSGLQDTLVSNLGGSAGLATLGEIQITDRAGNGPTTVDLGGAETLGEIVDAINAAGAGVEASINSARNGIQITDTSGGTGSLVIANGAESATADDLGIAVDAAQGSVDGGSLGRQTVSEATALENLDNSLGDDLSNIRITDSNGLTATVQLATSGNEATTIGDVIDRINSLAVGVEARINDSGDGVLLTDTAGGSGTLTVEEVGSGTTAAGLGLLGESSATDDSGQQVIDGTTRTTIDLSGIDGTPEGITLASLRGGEGIDTSGTSLFQVTSAGGESFVIDVSGATTIGDVLNAINTATNNPGTVTARVNDAQTGIVIEDTSAGGGQLTVSDFTAAGGQVAEQLGLIRGAGDTNDNEIDGAGLFSFSDDNALQLLADRINESEAGVTASIFADGDGFRLSLTTDGSGAANELLVDGLGAGLTFTETVRAGDAVAVFGGVGGLGGFAVTSENGQFDDVIDGVSVTVNQATGDPVTIDVAQDDSTVVAAVNSFVNAYNSLRGNLDTVTDFDADTQTTGILFGRGEAVRVDTELSRLLTDRFNVGGPIDNLQQIGISVNQQGLLELDQSRLNEALEATPGAVQDLFQDEQSGVLARFDEAIDRLAGDDDSLLSNRSAALTDTIEDNQSRIAELDAFLASERESLLLEFIQLEQTIALLQSNLSALSGVQPLSFAAPAAAS